LNALWPIQRTAVPVKVNVARAPAIPEYIAVSPVQKWKTPWFQVPV
jgi:hypothetical protein